MIIHADHGGFKIMPVTGRNTITVCGRYLPPGKNNKTTDDVKVTCKQCKNLLSEAL